MAETKLTPQLSAEEKAALESQQHAFITLGNLNTVYKEIRQRYDSISQLYNVQGDISWTELMNKSAKAVGYNPGTSESIAAGTVYTISVKGLSESEKAAEYQSRPESIQEYDNVLCFRDINNTSKGGFNKEDWQEYWKEIGGVFGEATADEAGLVSTSAQVFGGEKTFQAGKDGITGRIAVKKKAADTEGTFITPNQLIVGSTNGAASTATGELRLEGAGIATMKDASKLGVLTVNNNSTVNNLNMSAGTLELSGAKLASISTGSSLGELHSTTTNVNNINTVSSKTGTITMAEGVSASITGTGSGIGKLLATEVHVKNINAPLDTYDSAKLGTLTGTINTSQVIKVTEATHCNTLAATTVNVNQLDATKATLISTGATINTGDFNSVKENAGSITVTSQTTLKGLEAASATLATNTTGVINASAVTNTAKLTLKEIAPTNESLVLKKLSAEKATLNVTGENIIKASSVDNTAKLTLKETNKSNESIIVKSLNAPSSTLNVTEAGSISASNVNNQSGSLTAAAIDVKAINGSNTTIIIDNISKNTITAGSININPANADNKIILDGSTGHITAKKFEVSQKGNDYVDRLPSSNTLEPGYCYAGSKDHFTKTSKYGQSDAIGIHSDTFSMVIGRKEEGKKDFNIAISGFVLAYVDQEYPTGTPLTCTKNGMLTKANILLRIMHPERILATYVRVEDQEYWGSDSDRVVVNNRSWVKIK